jgi:hypothetical protein
MRSVSKVGGKSITNVKFEEERKSSAAFNGRKKFFFFFLALLKRKGWELEGCFIGTNGMGWDR